jgi:hypothetical protein
LIKRIPSLALLVAAAALLAVPAIGQANHKSSHNPGSKARGKSCAKKATVNKGFVVRGTLVSYTADNPATPANEATPLVITVTKANRHARLSGELTDANPGLAGVQLSVPTTDAFRVQLDEFEANEVPGAGDAVRIVGKVAVTRKKCATPQQNTLAKRYGAVNVRKVKFTEVD